MRPFLLILWTRSSAHSLRVDAIHNDIHPLHSHDQFLPYVDDFQFLSSIQISSLCFMLWCCMHLKRKMLKLEHTVFTQPVFPLFVL